MQNAWSIEKVCELSSPEKVNLKNGFQILSTIEQSQRESILKKLECIIFKLV
jgi:hypothetical protein